MDDTRIANAFLRRRLIEFDRKQTGAVVAELAWVNRAVLEMYDRVGCVLLFGSRVNGLYRDMSDYDLYVVCNPCEGECHDLRTVAGKKLDVHNISADGLVSRFGRERQQRFCFYTKSVSESICLYGKSIGSELTQMARSSYVCPGRFAGWARFKLNLDSQLDDRDKVRGELADGIYWTNLASLLLRYLSLRAVGWMARNDVMIVWLKECAPSHVNRLAEAYRAAMSGDPADLHGLCADVADGICKGRGALDNVSINGSGTVRPIAVTGSFTRV